MKVCLKKSGEFPKKNEVLVIKKFLQFLQSQAPLNEEVRITFTDSREIPMTTGVRMPDNEIVVLAKGRLLIDILRTISHEWVHEFQYQKMGVRDDVKIQDIGGPEENMCNILSGVFIKKFEKKYPEFNKEDEEKAIQYNILKEQLKPSMFKLANNDRKRIEKEISSLIETAPNLDTIIERMKAMKCLENEQSRLNNEIEIAKEWLNKNHFTISFVFLKFL
jgi:hypothetical protein